MLTRTAGYALHAAVALAGRHPEGGLVSATDLADELGVPGSYLSKILQSLVRGRILVSERGRSGGFRLARPPHEIRLIEVVGGFDDLGKERQCLLGHGACADVGACPAHAEWREASGPAFHFLETRTLADLAGVPARVESTP